METMAAFYNRIGRALKSLRDVPMSSFDCEPFDGLHLKFHSVHCSCLADSSEWEDLLSFIREM